MIRSPTIRRVWSACLLTACLLTKPAAADLTVPSTAPAYTAASVVLAATQTTGALAPNTIATVYGVNLAYDTYALTAADLVGGQLPTSLAGVSVLVYGIPCGLFYVSPGQINFLVPYELAVTSAPLQVTRQGVAGLPVTIQMALTAPAFFQWNGNLAIAEHVDGSLVSAGAPAQGGEVIVLYAAGLGRTTPDQVADRAPSAAATIVYASQMQILLNGTALPASSVLYAGVTPGFAGLYQINLQLPGTLPENPQIQVTIGPQSSPAAVLLPTAVAAQ
jgi:uncharacterized protein (TIGR03437 family)